MKLQTCVSILAVLGCAVAAPVSDRTWTTLTPSATIPSSVGAKTDFDGSFALSIKTLADSASTTASTAKRDVVNQITDGQVQQQSAKATASVVNQITDGQIQQQTAKKTTASVVNQITDGQIQQQSAKKTTASVVNQITDGQIQQQTAAKTTASVVNQIGDGQIQQQTAAKQTASVVNQIGDGQIQQQTAKTTASAVAQISDGQIQQHTTKAGQASQISDGQVQATSGAEATDSDGIQETCLGDDALALTLKGGELTDAKGRIGAIVANRQFQFDGPPPQAGTIYAGGWSLVPSSYSDGKDSGKSKRDTESWKLALGTKTTFYKCKSGDFYNLYDESIGGQCSPIEIEILKAVSC